MTVNKLIEQLIELKNKTYGAVGEMEVVVNPYYIGFQPREVLDTLWRNGRVEIELGDER